MTKEAKDDLYHLGLAMFAGFVFGIGVGRMSVKPRNPEAVSGRVTRRIQRVPQRIHLVPQRMQRVG